LALAAVLAFMVEAADARVGGGRSFGSRGTRTYTAPPTTQTAPAPAKPVERSMTQPSTGAVTQATAPPVASRFGTGFGGLLLGGLLGAGLFGLLTGAGLFGGLTGFASFLGLMLQVALIAGLAYAASPISAAAGSRRWRAHRQGRVVPRSATPSTGRAATPPLRRPQRLS
jgi:predicted lipid-binding transport protein (Tim44 family)